MKIAEMVQAAHDDPETAVLMLGQWVADNPDKIKEAAVAAANSPEGQAAIAQAKERARITRACCFSSKASCFFSEA